MIRNKDRNAVRVIELPACKMVWSGVCPGDHSTDKNEKLRRFNAWWPALDALRKDRFYTRDFMWYDEAAKGFAWGLAITEAPEDAAGYETIGFPGGLYAVANYNGDAGAVYENAKKWIEKSGCFAMDDGAGRHVMWHHINPRGVPVAMGYFQYDIYVPIRVKEDAK